MRPPLATKRSIDCPLLYAPADIMAKHERLALAALQALEPAPRLLRAVRRAQEQLRGLSDAGRYNMLHLRAEDDWIEHCARWTSTSGSEREREGGGEVLGVGGCVGGRMACSRAGGSHACARACARSRTPRASSLPPPAPIARCGPRQLPEQHSHRGRPAQAAWLQAAGACAPALHCLTREGPAHATRRPSKPLAARQCTCLPVSLLAPSPSVCCFAARAGAAARCIRLEPVHAPAGWRGPPKPQKAGVSGASLAAGGACCCAALAAKPARTAAPRGGRGVVHTLLPRHRTLHHPASPTPPPPPPPLSPTQLQGGPPRRAAACHRPGGAAQGAVCDGARRGW